MSLNASNRKKLNAALAASSRSKMTDAQTEEAAVLFIDGKKTKAELAEKYGVSVQTLAKRLHALAEDPALQAAAE